MEFKNRVKIVYFDLDNTLWDFHKNEYLTLQEIYDDHIKYIDKYYRPCEFINAFDEYNERLWEDYRQGKIKKEVLRAIRFKNTLEAMGIYKDDISGQLDEEFVTRTSMKPYLVDNAKEILDYLYGKYKMGIITNGFKDGQHRKLDSSNIRKYFDYVFISDEVGAIKPSKEIFEYALTSSGFLNDEAVFIGDDYKVDIIGANNAGINGIWFNRLDETINDKIDCIEIKNLLEIKKLL